MGATDDSRVGLSICRVEKWPAAKKGEVWVLGKSGATFADFSQVLAATDKAVPGGAQSMTPMCAAVDLGKLEIREDVQKSARMHIVQS
jgi:hypothetical protein